MHSSTQKTNIINVRITHKTANVQLLEAAAFKNKRNAANELHSLANVRECAVLQTCNRVELYLVSEDNENTFTTARKYLTQNANVMAEEASKAIENSTNQDALRHILRIASGLESMVIGEDQIINQLWDAYLEAESAKTVGPVLKHVFNKAVTVGRRVRKETNINKGAVSVGSVAVELAESLLGKFDDKKVLVLGAGTTGTLVAKAMGRRCFGPVFIANRTYARAVRLAEELSGRAVKFDQLGETLVDADVVICATSAPHYLLTKDFLSRLMKTRQNKNALIVIDISNPRNVEKSIEEIEQVRLYNIDDLQLIAEKNKRERQKSISDAEKILEEELVSLDREIKAETVRVIISDLLSRTEEIRQRELAKAIKLMGNLEARDEKIVGDLTSILLKQTFVPVIENLRLAAINNDKQLIELAIKLFNSEP